MNSIRYRLIACSGAAVLAATCLSSQRAMAQEIYTDNDEGTIQQVSLNDGTVTTVGSVTDAVGLTATSDGNLLVAQYNDGQIIEFNTTTDTQTIFANPTSSNGGVAIDPIGGSVYSSSGYYGGGAIYVIPPTGGSTSTALPTTGEAFDHTYGLAFDSTGDLFVGTYTDEEIIKITPSGVASEFASQYYPIDVAVNSSGDVFASRDSADFVYEYGPDGTLLNTLSIASVDSSSRGIYGLTLDSAGDLFVADDSTTTSSDIVEFAAGSTTPTIVATGLAAATDYITVVDAVPEPHTYALFLVSALAGLGMHVLRRRRSAA